MRLSNLMLVLALSASLSPAWGADRMFGKNAALREVAGEVIEAGTSSWGARYVVVKDGATGLRVFVQTDAAACSPGRPFKASGHLTRAADKAFDATFHGHLTSGAAACR